MLIEVFKSGSHTDSNGTKISYSLEQINQIVENYNQSIEEHPNDLAPLVKGHPKNDAPAYGWIKRLVRKKNTILADIVDIDKNLMNDMKNNKFKNFSIALYPNLQLRHIGILGAVPPAVKGLNKNGIVYFNANMEYNEYCHSIDIEDEQTKIIADEINNNGKNNNVKNNNSSENNNPTYSKTSQDAIETNKVIQKLKEQKTQLINKLHSLEKESFLSSINSFANSVCNSPNSPIAPSQKNVLIDILEHCYDADNYNKNSYDANIEDYNINDYSFSYSENTNGLTEKIKRFVSSISNVSNDLCSELDLREYSNNNAFEEFENPNTKVDLEKNELHKKALRYMSLHPSSSYMDAINSVL